MRPFKLLSLVGVATLALAQNTTDYASCTKDPQFGWMYNSLRQDPCTVAEYLGGVCNNGVFHIPPLNRTQEYIGPTAVTASPCRCSTVFFSLLSACAVCQLAQTTTWSDYDGNCSTIYASVFPQSIPIGTAVPHWAYMDVTQYDGFNVSVAQLMTDNPESTAVGSATSISTVTTSPTSSSSSSKSSSNAGPIAGGVVGGVFAIALVVILVLLLRRRKTTPPVQPNLTGPQQSQVPTGDKVPMGYQPYPSPPPPMQQPLLYDPSDPRTFPTSPPPIPITGATGSINPAITGSSFSSAPTSGTYFPGVAEV